MAAHQTAPRAEDGPVLRTLNPTPHARCQWVLYGADEPHEVVHRLPRSWINVARVRVPAGHVGEVHPLPPLPEDLPFAPHRCVRKVMDAGFAPWFGCDGERKPLALVGTALEHRRLRATHWRARTEHGICELFLYVFHDSPVVPFELMVFCESKDTYYRPMRMAVGLERDEGVIMRVRHGRADPLLDVPRMADCQGRRWFGSLLCWDEEALGHEEDGPTLRAEERFPLLALHPWKRWGAWGKQPLRLPAALRRASLERKSRQPFEEPFGHFGEILNRRPADTGYQPAFGTWQHLETIGDADPTHLFVDRLILAQECCRPIHQFEADGDIVRAAKHPAYVSWDETVHWHPSQSPDRLGRTHGRKGKPDSDWSGRDREHYSACWLSEDAMLHGSLASLRELEHLREHVLAGLTVPSIHGEKATNGMGAARGIGRMHTAIAQMWMATGDDRLPARIERRVLESILPQWPGRAVDGEVRPMRVIVDDRALPGRPAWIPWEDAIAVQGLDASRAVLAETGREVTADKVAELVWLVARSVVLYAFHPRRTVIAKCLAWDGTGKPLSLDALNDPRQAVWADNTDYAYWALPCIDVALRMARERKDEAVERKAAALERVLGPVARNDMTKARYLGAC
ncbi:MAG: hypothetical protein R3F30_14985 [Planctomycetota bacterium]